MAAAEDRDPTGPDASFSVVRHGFDRSQVRRRVQELEDSVERAQADRLEAQAQAAELQGELEIARREITALSSRLDEFGSGTGDSARLLEVAKSQATEVTDRAQSAAEHTWAAAEQASTTLRDRYQKLLAELDEQHAEIHAAHETIMSSAKSRVEEMTNVAERRRREIDAAAERDRVRIDREFSESMTTKREALATELASAKAAAEGEVSARLKSADEEAKRRVDSVTDQVRRLATVRTELASRLRETQEVLTRSAALLEPVPEEQEVNATPTQPEEVPTQREAKRPAKR